MSRSHGLKCVIVLLPTMLLSGCGSGLFNSSLAHSVAKIGGSTPKEGESWEPAGQSLEGYVPGVVAVVFGPGTDTMYGRTMATTHLEVHPADTRVSYLRSPEPQVTFWNEFRQPVFSMEIPKGAPETIRLTPDGKHFLFAARDGARSWSIADGSLELKVPTANSNAAISDDGRLVAVLKEEGSTRRIHVLTIEDGKELHNLDAAGLSVMPVAFLDSNRRLGCMGYVGSPNIYECTVWDLATGTHSPQIHVNHWRGAFSPDGSRYAAAADGNRVAILDTRNGTQLGATNSHSGDVWAITFSPDGNMLASAAEGEHGTIKISDARTGKEMASIVDDTSWGVTALAFSPDGTSLAAGNANGIVRFWKAPQADAGR